MCVGGRDQLEDLSEERDLMMKKLENHWPSCLGVFWHAVKVI